MTTSLGLTQIAVSRRLEWPKITRPALGLGCGVLAGLTYSNPHSLHAQGPVFSDQGQLLDQGLAPGGHHDFNLALIDVEADRNQAGAERATTRNDNPHPEIQRL